MRVQPAQRVLVFTSLIFHVTAWFPADAPCSRSGGQVGSGKAQTSKWLWSRSLSLWERPAGQRRVSAARFRQILRPSPYPLPDGEGRSNMSMICLPIISDAVAAGDGTLQT